MTDRINSDFQASGQQDLTDLAALGKGSQDSPSFETLLGPFDELSQILRPLRNFSSEPGSEELHLARDIKSFDDRITNVYRQGVSSALSIIHELTQQISSGTRANVNRFYETLMATVSGSYGDLTIATLNYDQTIFSSLLGSYGNHTCDMATPQRSGTVRGTDQKIYCLREKGSFPKGRAKILQLHGGLNWLKDKDDEFYIKVPMSAFLDLDVLTKWCNQDGTYANWDPAVILTNQKRKAQLVDEYPFRLAYEQFAVDLHMSDRFLIAGYGFGDAPLNAVLARELKRRRPKTLIVGYSSEDDGNVLLAENVRSILKLDSEFPLSTCIAGVPAVIDTDVWGNWLLE